MGVIADLGHCAIVACRGDRVSVPHAISCALVVICAGPILHPKSGFACTSISWGPHKVRANGVRATEGRIDETFINVYTAQRGPIV